MVPPPCRSLRDVWRKPGSRRFDGPSHPWQNRPIQSHGAARPAETCRTRDRVAASVAGRRPRGARPADAAGVQRLHVIASRYMAREWRKGTLQATGIVNEAYLKLIDQRRVDWRNRAQFFAIAAQLMRRSWWMTHATQVPAQTRWRRGTGPAQAPCRLRHPTGRCRGRHLCRSRLEAARRVRS